MDKLPIRVRAQISRKVNRAKAEDPPTRFGESSACSSKSFMSAEGFGLSLESGHLSLKSPCEMSRKAHQLAPIPPSAIDGGEKNPHPPIPFPPITRVNGVKRGGTESHDYGGDEIGWSHVVSR